MNNALQIFTAVAIAIFAGGATLAAKDISPYGMCAHLNRVSPEDMRNELKTMHRHGVRTVRVDLDWSQVEPHPRQWSFSQWDALVAEAAKYDISIIAILGGELHKPIRAPFRYQKDFLHYVSECAKRYKGKIAAYEVINEADCDRPWGEKPNPENYAELLKKTCNAIKAVDPAAKVIFSGVSFVRNPFPFLEKAFAAGGVEHCDALNFHPYQWKFVPEAQLRQKIAELRTLMRKYNLNKPVWVTEIGNSSAEAERQFIHDTVVAALKKLDIDPAKTVIGMIHDHENFYYADGIHLQPADYLPEAKKFRPLKFIEVKALSVKDCPVLIMPGVEGFPVRQFAFVRDYVKRGGTVIIPGGIPFYFNVEKQPGGMFTNAWLTRQCPGELHFGWEASWTKKNVPPNATQVIPGEEFPGLKSRQFWSGRFLNGDNLKGNDRMIPIFYGAHKEYKAPIAALYKFDSDLKGNLILLPGIMNECSSEKVQAELLARQYLLLRAENVEVICNYRFRAGEWNRGREAHFGIVRRNFSAKPAALAFETLTKILVANSSVKLTSPAPGLQCAEITRPDKSKVWALWTTAGEIAVRIAGHVAAVCDLYGQTVKSDSKCFVITPSITYFTAAPGNNPEFRIK